MSEQKKYKIGDKEVQLAPPTPMRVAEYLRLTGIKSFSELQNIETQGSLATFVLDLQVKHDMLMLIMQVCVLDPGEIDWLNVDSRIISQIVTDFFGQ